MAMTIDKIQQKINRILQEVERVIIGKKQILKMILTAILADGHILLEDYPGLAKTLIAKCIANALGLDYKRIQFTPDLLPSDITGSFIYNRINNSFELRKGPIFSNIVLADEINRASPKTQSALLEAMQEGQVTIEGKTMFLPKPFIVIATQNPIDYEGTFTLPEAQLDRFIVKLTVGYPSQADEQEILSRRHQRQSDDTKISAVIQADELLTISQTIETVFIHKDIEKYIVELVQATRQFKDVAVGASPRGSLAIFKLVKAWAGIQNRNYVIPDDIKLFLKPALNHRLVLAPALWMKQNAPQNIIDSICNLTNVPVIEFD